MTYEQQYKHYLQTLEQALTVSNKTFLPQSSQVCQAAQYSLMAGGKRVRGILTLAVCDLLGGNQQAAAQFACAVEMLHCYSLIHDDLPCMDNDDMRRGKPSCHKVYGESTALLAGDALLTEAFEVIASAPAAPGEIAQAVKALAHGAGSRGMVLGQELDLMHENCQINEDTLRQIHTNKTGALINAAAQLGVAAAGAGDEDATAIEGYAYDLGLVFQIVDDVLDVTSTQEELGKPIGSDSDNGKTTFVTLYGVQGAMQLAENINKKACLALTQRYQERADFLVELARLLVARKS